MDGFINDHYMLYVLLVASYRTIMLANNIMTQMKESTPLLSVDDVQKIRQFSRQRKFVRKLNAFKSHIALFRGLSVNAACSSAM